MSLMLAQRGTAFLISHFFSVAPCGLSLCVCVHRLSSLAPLPLPHTQAHTHMYVQVHVCAYMQMCSILFLLLHSLSLHLLRQFA